MFWKKTHTSLNSGIKDVYFKHPGSKKLMISNKSEPHAIYKTFSTNKIMEINAATSLKEKIVKVKI